MKRTTAAVGIATIVLTLFMSATAMAAPAIEVTGSGSISLVTYPSWDTETGEATITISAQSIGEPEMRTYVPDVGDPFVYPVYKARGIVTIVVDDPSLETSIKGHVKEMYSLWEGVYGVSIDYKFKGKTYSMYITDGAGTSSSDSVFLAFLIPILGDGSGYQQRLVEDGDFQVNFN